MYRHHRIAVSPSTHTENHKKQFPSNTQMKCVPVPKNYANIISTYSFVTTIIHPNTNT